jgi:glycosyltransferase involved in cell wall biosynthesis
MRALHLVKTSVGGTWAWRLVRELTARGTDCHVALPPGGPMVSRYSDVGAEVHPLSFGAGGSFIRIPEVLSNIRHLVRDVDPDVIHLHNVGPALLTRLALGRRHPIPRLFQVPGPLHLEHLVYRRGELATAGPSDSWIAASEYTKRLYVAAGVAPERVSVSYYGTDLDTFEPPEQTSDLRQELGLSPSTQIIGMVAYMYAPKRHLGQARGLKGHEDLIDAVAMGIAQGADIAVVFVGGAWDGATDYEQHLRELAAARCGNRALFLGPRSDIAQLYRNFDVSACPSLSENVGGAGESLLCGIPTVTTNIGAFPEVIKDGVTGWLVPPGDPPALWEAISDALSDPARAHALALAGHNLAEELFDVRRTSAQVQQTYNRVVHAG